jgi:hypothetical protein
MHVIPGLNVMRGWLLFAVLASCGLTTAADDVQFNRDIRPILSENCFACHGPDAKQRQAELRLDLRDDATDHVVATTGGPDESELVQRVFSSDPEQVMPPPDSHKTLTEKQKELLKQWVAGGAAYQGHWSYERPLRPEVPQGVHPVDYLIGR